MMGSSSSIQGIKLVFNPEGAFTCLQFGFVDLTFDLMLDVSI